MRSYSDMITKTDEGFFYKTLASAMGLGPSIVLKQIGFWCKVNEQAEKHDTHFHYGRWWMFDTYAGLTKRNFPYWHKDTVRNYVKFLEELGVLRIGHFNQKSYDQTNWYTPDDEKINAFMAHWEACGSPIRNGGGKQTDEYKAFIESWMELNKDNEPSENGDEEGAMNGSQGAMNGSQPPYEAFTDGVGTVHTPIPESTSKNTTKNFSLPAEGNHSANADKSVATSAPPTPSPGMPMYLGVSLTPPPGPVQSTGAATSLERDREEDPAPPESLEGYICERATGNWVRCSDAMRDTLNTKLKIRHPDNPKVLVEWGGMEEAWKDQPLFSAWVKEQIDYLDGRINRLSRDKIIKHLRKKIEATDDYHGWVQWSRRKTGRA